MNARIELHPRTDLRGQIREGWEAKCIVPVELASQGGGSVLRAMGAGDTIETALFSLAQQLGNIIVAREEANL